MLLISDTAQTSLSQITWEMLAQVSTSLFMLLVVDDSAVFVCVREDWSQDPNYVANPLKKNHHTAHGYICTNILCLGIHCH